MKKLPLVIICGISLGIILLSAFGESAPTPAYLQAITPPNDTAQTVNTVQDSSALTTPTPAILNASVQPTEESKVWCERHPLRCKHIHERKAKQEAERIEKLTKHCEKHPEDKKCEELKEINKTPDKQDEVTIEPGSTDKQLEKHLEEHR